MVSHTADQQHLAAAAHLRSAAENSERAAEQYTRGAYERAAHFAEIARSHTQHARGFMSNAAKLHAELHGGNKHTKIG